MRTPLALAFALIVTAATGVPAMAQDAEAGAILYRDFCAVCHGTEAHGDGPMAEALTVAPPDLTALGQGDAFPILRVIRQIDGRARIVAHGGEMPIFGAWFEGQGPDVALSGPGGQPVLMAAPVADLVAYLREIQQ